MTDIPKRYKLTEVGVIPDEWEMDFIENVAAITTGSTNTQNRIEDGDYPFFLYVRKLSSALIATHLMEKQS